MNPLSKLQANMKKRDGKRNRHRMVVDNRGLRDVTAYTAKKILDKRDSNDLYSPTQGDKPSPVRRLP